MRYRVLRMKRPILYIAFALAICAVVWSGLSQRAIYTVASQKNLPIYAVNTSDKQVALGINCAWGDEDIPQLLALLEESGVKASFFVTGTFCKRYPESVKAIFDAGHEVGSHSNTHTDLTTLNREGILAEIRGGNEKIKAITGVPATLFRTPSGAYNDLVISLIAQEGMYPIQWDCDSMNMKTINLILLLIMRFS